jgi:hypothetical protein
MESGNFRRLSGIVPDRNALYEIGQAWNVDTGKILFIAGQLPVAQGFKIQARIGKPIKCHPLKFASDNYPI